MFCRYPINLHSRVRGSNGLPDVAMSISTHPEISGPRDIGITSCGAEALKKTSDIWSSWAR